MATEGMDIYCVSHKERIPRRWERQMLALAAVLASGPACAGDSGAYAPPKPGTVLMYLDAQRGPVVREVVDATPDSYSFVEDRKRVEVLAAVIPLRPTAGTGISDSEREKARRFLPVKAGNATSFEYHGYTTSPWREYVQVQALDPIALEVQGKTYGTIPIQYQSAAPGWYERKGTCWFEPVLGVCVKEQYRAYLRRNPSLSGDYVLELQGIKSPP